MADNNPFIKQILALEKSILESNDNRDFPLKVESILRDTRPFTFMGLETLQDCLHYHKIVPQYYGARGFGKFNLTLVNNQSFFIIVMFMDQQGTEIHDHPFWGCFTSLLGSPYEITFDYKNSIPLMKEICSGELVPITSKRIRPMEPVLINMETIHLISRPSGGQFSLLIGQLLPPAKRQNFHFYYPGLRVRNRMDYTFMGRVQSFMEQVNSDYKKVEDLAGKLEPDELLRLLQNLRSGTTTGLLNNFQNVIKIKYPEIWMALEAHDAYMEKLEKKLKLV